MKMFRRETPKKLDVRSLRSAYEDYETYEERVHAAASWYVKNGFHIVPFGPNGFPKGFSQKHVAKTVEAVDKWFSPYNGLYRGMSIAFAHGGASGLCAVDLDVKDGVDGIRMLSDLVAAYGDYNDADSSIDTLMATTPSGGKHLIFRFHPEITNNAKRHYEGIDTRGGNKKDPSENGGITFVEPSRKPVGDGNHEDIYRWDDTSTDIIDMPSWLADTLNGMPPQRGLQLQESYIQSAPGLHGEGRDRNIYMDLMRFAGAGATEEELWALAPRILERMSPPDEGMVRKKIESVLESEAFKDAGEKKETTTRLNTMGLELNRKGFPLKNNNNLLKILNSAAFAHGYGDVRYDDFYRKFMCNGKPMAGVSNWGQQVAMWISRNVGLDYAADPVRHTLEVIAEHEREHTNVARDYFMSCPPYLGERQDNYWGSNRRGPGPAFEKLCTKVLQLGNRHLNKQYTDEHKEAYRAFLWFWLQGALARACVPGCKVEIVLNIFGGQGIGKSTFFRELLPDSSWFSDSLSDAIVTGNFGNKDELAKLHAKVIVEMPELSPVKTGGKAGDDKMKQFISAQQDDMRMPFSRDVVSHFRTCVLAGTSNNNDIYRDVTGDRRFVSIDHGNVPILLGDQDKGVMDEIRDELWGEVRDSFLPGELDKPRNALLVCIPALLRDIQRNLNNHHRYEEIGIPELISWMQGKTRLSWDEIMVQARTIAGLRDSKENTIIRLVRAELSNSPNWVYRKRNVRQNADGDTKKGDFWVDTEHPLERAKKSGDPSFEHWSQYTKEYVVEDTEEA